MTCGPWSTSQVLRLEDSTRLENGAYSVAGWDVKLHPIGDHLRVQQRTCRGTNDNSLCSDSVQTVHTDCSKYQLSYSISGVSQCQNRGPKSWTLGRGYQSYLCLEIHTAQATEYKKLTKDDKRGPVAACRQQSNTRFTSHFWLSWEWELRLRRCDLGVATVEPLVSPYASPLPHLILLLTLLLFPYSPNRRPLASLTSSRRVPGPRLSAKG